MEDYGYYRDFPRCDSSFSSSSFSPSEPLTPSTMSSRRPSLAEEALLYVTDSPVDKNTNSAMAIDTKATPYGSPLKQILQPVAVVNPMMFSDGLSKTLHFQSTVDDETDMQSTFGFQLDNSFYQQQSQIFLNSGPDISDTNLLDMGVISIDARLTFYENCFPQAPRIKFQDNVTVDPTKTQHLFLDAVDSEYNPLASTALFEPVSSVLPDDLCSPSARAVNFLDASPRSSSDYSMSDHASLSSTTLYGSQSSCSAGVMIDALFDDEDIATAESRITGTCRPKKRSHSEPECPPLTDKIRTSRIKKSEAKSKSVLDGISCTVTKCKPPKVPCGVTLADGTICDKKFERKEHAKRHRETHEKNAKEHPCPDPDCVRDRKKKFKARGDNKKQHIVRTHIMKPKAGPRNRRWSREEAEQYGYVLEWDLHRGSDAAKSEVEEPQAHASKGQKSKSRNKSSRRASDGP